MLREMALSMPSYISDDMAADVVALSAEEVRERMSGNLCRCGAHNGIVEAIMTVVKEDAA
jgi:xanthine dehydrogenase YagT iron-sulfur-binding subunit